MSLLQKIFTPRSSKKKGSLLHADLENGEKVSRSSPKASVSTRIKRKTSDEDDCDALGPSLSMTVNVDPVPLSFKTNSSFANQAKTCPALTSPKSLRESASFSVPNSYLNRHHQHNATLASSASRYHRSSLFDKSAGLVNSSFATGDTTLSAGSGTTANNGTVNLWRLPWTQQKVVMCPNCHRPRKVDRATTYVSRADYSVPQTSDPHVADDISEASGDVSCSDSEDADRPLMDSTTYCRCGAALLGGMAEPSAATEEQPPVFVVEAKKSSNVMLPGTIAHDSDTDSDTEMEGTQRTYKLSFVSPLTQSSLRRQQPLVSPIRGPASQPASSAASSAPKVSTWLNEQSKSEGPAASKRKLVS